MALENIPYDVLVVLGRQRFGDAIELDTSPGRGWHTARDWVIGMSGIHVMKGWRYELQQSMDLRDLWSAMSRETGSDRQYLIHAIRIALFWTFRFSKDNISGCGSGLECRRVEIEAMATISSPTSAGRYFMSVARKYHNNTLLCRLGLFGPEISRACPSLFCLTRPCCRCQESLKLFWI